MEDRAAGRSYGHALSLRAIEREYGLGREFSARLVREGTFRGIQHGRAILVLREDVENWWNRQCITRRLPIDERIEAILDREGVE